MCTFYSRHKDASFFAFLRERVPCVIVIFVRANPLILTELAQPLDVVGFNFVFKHGIFERRASRSLKKTMGFFAGGGEPEEFVPDNLLSELKEPMCQYVGDEMHDFLISP